jgi:hypothetical protein
MQHSLGSTQDQVDDDNLAEESEIAVTVAVAEIADVLAQAERDSNTRAACLRKKVLIVHSPSRGELAC